MPLVTYTGTKISTRWNQELGKGEKQGSSHTTGKLNWYSFFWKANQQYRGQQLYFRYYLKELLVWGKHLVEQHVHGNKSKITKLKTI